MTLISDLPERHVEMLSRIGEADRELAEQFSAKMTVNHDLDRRLVSFQANREEIGHRWCKYREGFSASLIRYIIEKTGLRRGTILDPFAGSGTTVFIAAELGLDAVGIELLPSSAEIIEVRNAVVHADKQYIAVKIRDVLKKRAWLKPGPREKFSHVRITAGAFPEENESRLGRFLHEASEAKDQLIGRLLKFAALCILEEISFTRKDGQYLRWDQRSGRCIGKSVFDKGRIIPFNEAIEGKLKQILAAVEGIPEQPELFAPPVNDQKLGKIDSPQMRLRLAQG